MKRKQTKVEKKKSEIEILIENAEKGDAFSQYSLGMMYIEGGGS